MDENLERDLDLWPCDLDQGQRSGGPMVKTPSHYLLPFMSFTHICDVSNNQGEITPIRSYQIFPANVIKLRIRPLTICKRFWIDIFYGSRGVAITRFTVLGEITPLRKKVQSWAVNCEWFLGDRHHIWSFIMICRELFSAFESEKFTEEK